MLKLKRFEGQSFFILDREKDDKILLNLIVTKIDPLGDFVDIDVKSANDYYTVRLGTGKPLLDLNSLPLLDDYGYPTVYPDNVNVRGMTDMFFGGVYKHHGRLSATIGFETDYKVIRHELLDKPERKSYNVNNDVRITR